VETTLSKEEEKELGEEKRPWPTFALLDSNE
jgi:hypothetical protein